MNLDRGVRQLWIGLAAADTGGSFLHLLLVRIVMLVRKTNVDIIGKRKSGWLIQMEGLGGMACASVVGFPFFGRRQFFIIFL